jgi:hypothetical protein
LEPGYSSVPLAVASVPEALGSADARPQLAMDGCFVRGKGDVVLDRSDRAFDLDVQNTLAVLTGSFLKVESAGDAIASGPGIRVTLSKVTT